jgi:hypothetical protein
LHRAGLDVRGGHAPKGSASYAPAAELIVPNGTTPTFIAFYDSAAKAQSAEPILKRHADQFGGGVVRRGAVNILFSRKPTADEKTAISRCVLG